MGGKGLERLAFEVQATRAAAAPRRLHNRTARSSSKRLYNFFCGLSEASESDCFLYFYQQQREVLVIEVELRIPC